MEQIRTTLNNGQGASWLVSRGVLFLCITTVSKGEMGGLCVNIDFLVIDSLKVESLIGIDFLEKHGCVVNLQEGVL